LSKVCGDVMKFLNIFIIMLIFPKVAYAYIDPGTMTIILQVLGSIFVGTVVFFRSIKEIILRFYYRIFPSKKKKNGSL